MARKTTNNNKNHRFTINNVSYTAKPFDFFMVCELEDMGVSFERIDKIPMNLMCAYFAICADVTKEEAAQLIQDHLINGGSLDDITEPIAKEMNDSDFFHALSKKQEQTSTEIPGTGSTAEKEPNEKIEP